MNMTGTTIELVILEDESNRGYLMDLRDKTKETFGSPTFFKFNINEEPRPKNLDIKKYLGYEDVNGRRVDSEIPTVGHRIVGISLLDEIFKRKPSEYISDEINMIKKLDQKEYPFVDWLVRDDLYKIYSKIETTKEVYKEWKNMKK